MAQRSRTLVCSRRCSWAFFATASLCASAFLIVLVRWAICVIAPRVFFEGIPIWYMLGEFQSKTGFSLDNCASLQHAQVWEGAGLLFQGVSVTLLLIVASYLVLDHRRCGFERHAVRSTKRQPVCRNWSDVDENYSPQHETLIRMSDASLADAPPPLVPVYEADDADSVASVSVN